MRLRIKAFFNRANVPSDITKKQQEAAMDILSSAMLMDVLGGGGVYMPSFQKTEILMESSHPWLSPEDIEIGVNALKTLKERTEIDSLLRGQPSIPIPLSINVQYPKGEGENDEVFATVELFPARQP